jgi:hypothetical protein
VNFSRGLLADSAWRSSSAQARFHGPPLTATPRSSLLASPIVRLSQLARPRLGRAHMLGEQAKRLDTTNTCQMPSSQVETRNPTSGPRCSRHLQILDREEVRGSNPRVPTRASVGSAPAKPSEEMSQYTVGASVPFVERRYRWRRELTRSRTASIGSRLSWPKSLSRQGSRFNQFLLDAEEPLLFHTGMRQLFPAVSEASGRVMPLERLRWIAFGHVEADECGAMKEFLDAAPPGPGGGGCRRLPTLPQ